ncbi:MAG TPA: hypothetical protein VGL38_08675 [bacterium]|jgi:hypothetical protein
MSTVADLPDYRYRGARAMILMHERAMAEFIATWRRAKAANLALPQTEDPDYASLEALLHHVLRAARGYMVWMCEKLGLPDPQIDPAPPAERVAAEAEGYLLHLNSRWRLPLVSIDEEAMSRPSYKSRWNMDYPIEAMMEHALVHPQRHRFQLEEMMMGR